VSPVGLFDPPPLSVASDDTQEHHTHIPADQGITDFGPLPRQRYPLVAVLTLAEPEARNVYNIVSPTPFKDLKTNLKDLKTKLRLKD